MFTGIVEEIGTVKRIVRGSQSCSAEIKASEVLAGTKIGDSIAVNGVCLTVTAVHDGGFSADIMPETLRRSSLGELSSGSTVNLERAMPLNVRFGGHIVSGHIDGTGIITEMKRENNAVWVKIAANPDIIELIVEKGSITIDGISLTVAKTGNSFFEVSIIPHTGSKTILLSKRPGAKVNLENDIVGKYVKKLLFSYKKADDSSADADKFHSVGGLTIEFLENNGFLN